MEKDVEKSLVNGKYQSSRLMTIGDIAKSAALTGFELNLEEFFGDFR